MHPFNLDREALGLIGWFLHHLQDWVQHLSATAKDSDVAVPGEGFVAVGARLVVGAEHEVQLKTGRG